MKIDHGYTEIRNTVNRLTNDLAEEQIYNLSVEIRKGIKNITGESIPEWGGAFQIISDIAEAHLSNTLDWDNFYLSDIHADLTCNQVEDIINRV